LQRRIQGWGFEELRSGSSLDHELEQIAPAIHGTRSLDELVPEQNVSHEPLLAGCVHRYLCFYE
jgi:hypothetical protein